MTESRFANSPTLTEEKQDEFVTEPEVKDEPVRVNNSDEVEPPHVNDAGELVDSEGNKVFTTIEESLKDGSMVLDEQGRMPGVYLDDLEREARLRHAERVEEAFEKASEADNSPVERQVNVASSPLPPITVHSRQEQPIDESVEI